MRWWLAAVFVAIATLTAALIAAVSSRQADRELRANAENIALGAGISARSAVEQAIIDGNLDEQLPSIGARHNVALFVFSAEATADRVGPLQERALGGRARGRRRGAHGARRPALRRRVPRRPLDARRAAARPPARAPRCSSRTRRSRRTGRRSRSSATTSCRRRSGPSLIAALTGLVAATLISRRLRRICELGRGDRAGRLRAASSSPGCTTRSATSRSRSTACASGSATRSSS